MADQTYDQVALAAEQLDVALSLFLNEQSLVSALTLAGAAEEILGKAVSLAGEQNSLDWKYAAVERTHTLLHRRPLSRPDFIQGDNRARNASKHIEAENQQFTTADLEDDAIWMIVRACDNSDRLFLPRSARRLEFDSWFYENIVGN